MLFRLMRGNIVIELNDYDSEKYKHLVTDEKSVNFNVSGYFSS